MQKDVLCQLRCHYNYHPILRTLNNIYWEENCLNVKWLHCSVDYFDITMTKLLKLNSLRLLQFLSCLSGFQVLELQWEAVPLSWNIESNPGDRQQVSAYLFSLLCAECCIKIKIRNPTTFVFIGVVCNKILLFLQVLPVSKSSQMITFTFQNGCVATLRTSGTEPKIKYYAEMCALPEQRSVAGLLQCAFGLKNEIWGLFPVWRGFFCLLVDLSLSWLFQPVKLASDAHSCL